MFVFICVVIFTLFVLLKIEPKKNIASQTEKTYISDEDLEYKRNVERLKNEELFKQVLPVIEALNKKEKTLQDMILELGDKVDGLTLDDYYKNPKHLKVETDDLKENEDGSFELKVAYKVEKREVGDVVEF